MFKYGPPRLGLCGPGLSGLAISGLSIKVLGFPVLGLPVLVLGLPEPGLPELGYSRLGHPITRISYTWPSRNALYSRRLRCCLVSSSRMRDY